MIPSLLAKLFRRHNAVDSKKEGPTEIPLVDPLDPLVKQDGDYGWGHDRKEPTLVAIKLRPVADFPVFDGLAGTAPVSLAKTIGDAAMTIHAVAQDDGGDATGMLKAGPNSEYTVPAMLQSWYMSQGFIGYQACAIIAQQWMVDKACSMAGEDAARNGWVIKARGGDDLDEKEHEIITEADKFYKIKDNLIELNRFKNIFGIRVAIFQVDSDDPLYYEKPFNIDGIKEGSYRGISQVDPYWMMPVMTTKGTSDPSAIGFYDPEYWTISGKKYHKTHLVIVRGPQPADILKPTYIFGGVPLTQRIYERVYAAERTANEAPLMAMSKRTMAIHADLDKVMANQAGFEKRLMQWIKYRDNHGVKVLGNEEKMEQFDTNMSDFDSIIMNQFQLVAAIARVPATKLLGTSPKGFNATGEFEMLSYHEELESIQEHVMMPLLERHYDILMRHLGLNTQVEIVCNPVDSITGIQRSDLNDKKAQTGINLINAGVISPDEERQRIKEDEHSGYNRLTDAKSNATPGLSPENIAAFQKAGAATEKAGASATEASAGAVTAKPGEPGAAEGSETDTIEGAGSPLQGAMAQLLPAILMGLRQTQSTPVSPDPVQAALLLLLTQMVSSGTSMQDLERAQPPIRGTHPGTTGVDPSVKGVHGIVGEVADEAVQDWNPTKLPKLRVDGLNCVIENPRGTVRKGMDMDGKQWRVNMPHHYGYVKGYEGADGDEVDCFIGKNLRSKDVFIVSQNDKEGEFDEYKCMLGFDSEDDAKQAYEGSFTRGWDGFGSIQKMSMADFKSWLEAGEAAKDPALAS